MVDDESKRSGGGAAGPSPCGLPSGSLGEDDALTLKGGQEAVDRWIHTLGVRYFDPLTNLAQLVEEVGELARVLSRTYGEQSFKKGESPSDLGDEMADVLFVLICLANQSGVDLETALRRNLEKKSRRDRDRHRTNPKLASSDSAAASLAKSPDEERL